MTNVVFTHDDTHLASGDEGGDILLHSVAAESPPTVLRASSPLGALRQMHFFPTRSHLLSGAYHDGSIQIWDTKQGQVISIMSYFLDKPFAFRLVLRCFFGLTLRWFINIYFRDFIFILGRQQLSTAPQGPCLLCYCLAYQLPSDGKRRCGSPSYFYGY